MSGKILTTFGKASMVTMRPTTTFSFNLPQIDYHVRYSGSTAVLFHVDNLRVDARMLSYQQRKKKIMKKSKHRICGLCECFFQLFLIWCCSHSVFLFYFMKLFQWRFLQVMVQQKTQNSPAKMAALSKEIQETQHMELDSLGLSTWLFSYARWISTIILSTLVSPHFTLFKFRYGCWSLGSHSSRT